MIFCLTSVILEHRAGSFAAENSVLTLLQPQTCLSTRRRRLTHAKWGHCIPQACGDKNKLAMVGERG